MTRTLGAPQEDTGSDRCIVNVGNSPISTSKGQEGVKVGGRTVISIPKIPSPAPNDIFMDHQKMEPSNPTVPKVAETK